MSEVRVTLKISAFWIYVVVMIVLAVMLVIVILTAGCIQTPAKVASGMPSVLKNVSNDVGNVTGSIQRNISEFVVGTLDIPVEPVLVPIRGGSA